MQLFSQQRARLFHSVGVKLFGTIAIPCKDGASFLAQVRRKLMAALGDVNGRLHTHWFAVLEMVFLVSRTTHEMMKRELPADVRTKLSRSTRTKKE